MKLPLFLLLLLVHSQVEAQLCFVTNDDNTITITGYAGTGAVEIPSTTNGYPVTSIGDYAFTNSSLTAITIPASITNIGLAAFAYSSSLTNAAIVRDC